MCWDGNQSEITVACGMPGDSLGIGITVDHHGQLKFDAGSLNLEQ